MSPVNVLYVKNMFTGEMRQRLAEHHLLPGQPGLSAPTAPAMTTVSATTALTVPSGPIAPTTSAPIQMLSCVYCLGVDL